MRVSVSQMKGRGTTNCRQSPTEGSRRKGVWDILWKYKGRIAPYEELLAELGDKPILQRQRHFKDILVRLRDDYELDIRLLGFKKYCLCGMFEGSKYIDFIAENHH